MFLRSGNPLRHVTSCHATSRHVTPCHVMRHHVTSCNVMSRHVMYWWLYLVEFLKFLQFKFFRSGNPSVIFLLSYHVWKTSKSQVSFRFMSFSRLLKHSFFDKNALNLKAVARKSRDGHTTNALLSSWLYFHDISRHATSCHVISRHFISCHDMPRHVTSCHST